MILHTFPMEPDITPVSVSVSACFFSCESPLLGQYLYIFPMSPSFCSKFIGLACQQVPGNDCVVIGGISVSNNSRYHAGGSS